jgi:hypothetical protein
MIPYIVIWNYQFKIGSIHGCACHTFMDAHVVVGLYMESISCDVHWFSANMHVRVGL